MKSISVICILHADCLTLMSVTDVLDAAVNDIPDISLRSSPANGELHFRFLIVFYFKWRSFIVNIINILRK